MTVSIGKQKQIVKNAENTEYTAEGGQAKTNSKKRGEH